jgi:uncharacterized protein
MLESDLRFRCRKGCTNCCEAGGHVYLTPNDIAQAALHLGMDSQEFEERHVVRRLHVARIKVDRDAKGKQAHCPFLSETGCSIHEAKPLQCRTFPFWPEVVESKAAWKKTGERCPGIDTGPLIQIETIASRVAEVKAAFPDFY